MGALPAEPAPQQGLESIVAYAEQAARRQPAPARSTWRWLGAALPVGGLLALLAVVATRGSPETVLAPRAALSAAPPESLPDREQVPVSVADGGGPVVLERKRRGGAESVPESAARADRRFSPPPSRQPAAKAEAPAAARAAAAADVAGFEPPAAPKKKG